jgi:hypothetical protein
MSSRLFNDPCTVKLWLCNVTMAKWRVASRNFTNYITVMPRQGPLLIADLGAHDHSSQNKRKPSGTSQENVRLKDQRL